MANMEDKWKNTYKNISNTIKDKLNKFWKKLNTFDKFVLIGITLFVLLGILSFFLGRIISGVISILQISLIVVALLMKKQVIKNIKTWIPVVITIISFVMIIPYFSSFKVKIADYKKYEWNDIVLSNIIEKPKSPYGEIISNSNKHLAIYINNTSKSQFSDYIKKCKEKGFDIDLEQTDNSFNAYNEEGYKLSLYYYENDKKMYISIDAAMELGTLMWPESELAKLVPVPKSTVGNIEKDENTNFVAYVGNTSKDDYNNYITSCIDNGFTVNSNRTDKQYSAKNENSYKILIEYIGNNTMKIIVYEPEYDISVEIECVENWIFSQYDVKVYINDNYKGTIIHGGTETYNITLNKGKHSIKFVSAEDENLTGNIDVDVSKNETLKFKISCTSFGINIQTIVGTTSETSDADKSEENESTDNPIEGETSNQEESKAENTLETELEKIFPKEYAKRAIIVAMTNGTAVDVFKSDGNTYDISKFHKYSDTSDYYLSIYSEGNWSAKDSKTWHVEDMTLEIEAFNVDSALKLNADIVFDGENYIISKVHYVQGLLKYLDSNDPSKLNMVDDEARDSTPYLTVPENLISENRNGEPIKNELDESSIISSAKTSFEAYGESQYPYGFKCHWVANFIACEVRDDGSCYIKVGVTITNQYGTERKTVAEGVVKGSSVSNFYVSN